MHWRSFAQYFRRHAISALAVALVFGLVAGGQPIAFAQDPVRYVFIGDPEGMDDGLKTYLDSGDLKLVNGRLEIGKPNTRIVLLGDLPDRGPHSIRMRELYTSLSQREPERFVMIMGNREGNKLDIMRELPEVKELKRKDYVEYLEKAYAQANGKSMPTSGSDRQKVLTEMNGVERQLDFLLRNKSAPQALEFHRQELSELRKKNVTLREAAQDYIKGLQPGGEHFEYIKRTQLAYSPPGQDLVVVHGGVTEANLGQVPGDTTIHENPDDWAKKLNQWGKDRLKEYEQAVRGGKKGAQIPGILSEFSEAIWDGEVIDYASGRKGMLTFNDRSPVYPYRSKTGDNFRPLPTKVSEILQKYGKRAVYNGHSPSPNGPTVTNDGKVLNAMVDTSMSSKGKGVYVQHTVGDGLYTRWTTGDGTPVEYSVKPGQDTLIGKVTPDGYTINGLTPDGRVVLSRYSDPDKKRFEIQERVVSRSEIDDSKVQFPQGGTLDVDATAYLGNVQRALREQKGVHFMTLDDARTFVAGKHVITVMSASKLARLPASEEALSKLAKEMTAYYVKKYGKENIVVLWGGTDVSKGELAFVSEFQKLGVPDVGFVNQGVIFKDVGVAKNLVVAGKGDDWVTAIKTSVTLTKERGGEIIAMGGGPIVKEVLESAEKDGVRIHAMKGDPAFTSTAGGTGGASAEFASSRPASGFSAGRDLIAKTGSSNPTAQKPLKIGVFTGSFDPPHLSHREAVEKLKKEKGLDIVYVVPDKTAGYKPGIQSLEHRKHMIELMFADDPSVRVLPPELEEKTGKGEMWNVLKAVQRENPEAKVYSIMGSDTAEWYSKLPAEKRAEGVEVLVNNRAATGNNYSSTQLKNDLKAGKTPQGLDPKVTDYIRSNQLYANTDYTKQGTSTLDEIQRFFKARGKKVVTLTGYSGTDYQDKPGMLKKVREIFGSLDPKTTIINIGGTVDGLGVAYEVAKEMGFETTGIVSVKAKEYPSFSKYVDHMFLVEDKTWGGYLPGTEKLSPTSQAMVENSDKVIALGGGPVAADESRAAKKMGKDFEFVPFDFNHEKAIKKAEKGGQPAPTDFRGAAHEALQPLVSKATLIQNAERLKPPKSLFVKDAPVLAYKIKSGKFEDIPEEIRKHIGATDRTKYTPEYLQKNIGSVIALQMNGDKADFYVIGKDTFESKYASVPLGDVSAKNAKYFGKVKQQIPGLVEGKNPDLVAVLKTTPTEMIRLSDLGYAKDKEVTIESPWGEQTKPANQDAFLVWDEGKKQYYMVNTGEDGRPISYVEKSAASQTSYSFGSSPSGSKEDIPDFNKKLKDIPRNSKFDKDQETTRSETRGSIANGAKEFARSTSKLYLAEILSELAVGGGAQAFKSFGCLFTAEKHIGLGAMSGVMAGGQKASQAINQRLFEGSARKVGLFTGNFVTDVAAFEAAGAARACYVEGRKTGSIADCGTAAAKSISSIQNLKSSAGGAVTMGVSRQIVTKTTGALLARAIPALEGLNKARQSAEVARWLTRAKEVYSATKGGRAMTGLPGMASLVAEFVVMHELTKLYDWNQLRVQKNELRERIKKLEGELLKPWTDIKYFKQQLAALSELRAQLHSLMELDILKDNAANISKITLERLYLDQFQDFMKMPLCSREWEFFAGMSNKLDFKEFPDIVGSSIRDALFSVGKSVTESAKSEIMRAFFAAREIKERYRPCDKSCGGIHIQLEDLASSSQAICIPPQSGAPKMPRVWEDVKPLVCDVQEIDTVAALEKEKNLHLNPLVADLDKAQEEILNKKGITLTQARASEKNPGALDTEYDLLANETRILNQLNDRLQKSTSDPFRKDLEAQALFEAMDRNQKDLDDFNSEAIYFSSQSYFYQHPDRIPNSGQCP